MQKLDGLYLLSPERLSLFTSSFKLVSVVNSLREKCPNTELFLLENWKWYGLFEQTISLEMFQKLSSANSTWSTLEHIVSFKISYIRDLLIIFVVSLFLYLFDLHFDLVKVFSLWSDISKAPHFQVYYRKGLVGKHSVFQTRILL